MEAILRFSGSVTAGIEDESMKCHAKENTTSDVKGQEEIDEDKGLDTTNAAEAGIMSGNSENDSDVTMTELIRTLGKELK